MMTITSRILKLPLCSQRILFEALFLLSLARLMILLVPFNWIIRVLKNNDTGEIGLDMHNKDIVNKIQYALHATARFVPWRCRCLDLTIAGKTMLDRRGIPCTLYLGLMRDQGLNLKAHSWLQCGSTIVAGKLNYEKFKVVFKMGNEER